MKRTFATLVLVCAGISAQARVLWDNNVVPVGYGTRAISPPGFPNIRVVDDIRVSSPGWLVDTVRIFVIEDAAWRSGPTIDVYLYNDDDGESDGVHVYVADLPFTKTAGASYFGRAGFTYNINVGGMNLAPGNYWIGMRNSGGSGSGTNYWMLSDAGPDGAGTSHGYFSLDGGNTWMPEGSGYHHAFRIEGEFVPEPATMPALGAGLAVLAARRRRR